VKSPVKMLDRGESVLLVKKKELTKSIRTGVKIDARTRLRIIIAD